MSIVKSAKDQLQTGSIGQWYLAKSATDRLIIKIVSGLIVAALFYSVIWKPVSDYNVEQQARYAMELSLSEWIALNQSALKRTTSLSVGGNTAPPLLPSITTAANRTQLKLDRLQPDSDGGVNVTLQEQRFDQVLNWLSLLEDKQRLKVERLSIDRGDRSGNVSGQVKLTRSEQ